MNEQALLDRIAQLTEEKDNAQALYRTLDGALQDCQFWLTKLRSHAEPDAENGQAVAEVHNIQAVPEPGIA